MSTQELQEGPRREWESIQRGLLRRGSRRSPLLSHVADPRVHFSILPAHPYERRIDFNDEFWEWWSQPPAHPLTGEPGSRTFQPTSTSADAVLVHRNGRLDWEAALGIQRSGIFQMVLDERAALWPWKEERVFGLVPLTAWIWTSANRFAEAVAKYDLSGPFLLSLVMFDTTNALLGSFGQGWVEPNQAFGDELVRCAEQDIKIQADIPSWPPPSELTKVVYLFGERIDNAWGSHARRFLDRTGPRAGEFSSRGL